MIYAIADMSRVSEKGCANLISYSSDHVDSKMCDAKK